MFEEGCNASSASASDGTLTKLSVGCFSENRSAIYHDAPSGFSQPLIKGAIPVKQGQAGGADGS